MGKAVNSKTDYHEGWLSLALQIFERLPNRPGAACIGHEALFDPAHRNEPLAEVAVRHEAAARLCRTCPALADCAAWSASQPATRAVVGGIIPRQVGRSTTSGL